MTSSALALAASVTLLAGCDSAGEKLPARSISERWEAAPICAHQIVAASPRSLDLETVPSLDVDSHGQVFVLNGGFDPHVIVLSASGQPLRRIGRRGEGPGEFDRPRDVQVGPGDTLFVYDKGLARFTAFDPVSYSAAYTLNLMATARPAFGGPPFDVYKADNGFLVAIHRRYYNAAFDPRTMPPARQVVTVLRPDGSVFRDSVLVLDAPSEYFKGHLKNQPAVVFSALNPAGRRAEVWVGPHQRLYYGFGDSLAIQIYNFSGGQIGELSASYTPLPFTKRDLDDLLAHHSFRTAIREQVPDTWPAFQHFFVDEMGQVWVGVLASTGQPTMWTIFGHDGAAECRVPLPRNIRLMAANQHHAYGVRIDSLDVPTVVIYDIARPAG